MARSSALAFVVLMVYLLGLFVTSSEGRKTFMVLKQENNSNKKGDRSNTMRSAGSLFLSALPKGKVPFSAPSKKGHSNVVNQKLIGRHLIIIDRSLRSVPSPGVGH